MSNRQKITRIAKKRGFFFQTAKNHGSIGGLYSLGPTGAETYRNILQSWKQEFVRKQGFQEVRSPTILPESVFDASGHLGSFNDAMVKCNECGSMHRSDKLIERDGSYEDAESLSYDEMSLIIDDENISCPTCGSTFGDVDIENFNLMFKTPIGTSQTGFLRPETAQGTFCDLPEFVQQSRQEAPYGFAQIGEAYRNEISPRRNLIRKREFSQAELEVFVLDSNPDSSLEGSDVPIYTDGSINRMNPSNCPSVGNQWIAYYMARTYNWLCDVGINPDKIRFRKHGEEELAHYASECWDAEALIHNNWTEIVGIANRESHDIKNHEEYTGQDYTIFNPYDEPEIVEDIDVSVDMGILGPKYGEVSQKIRNLVIDKIRSNPDCIGERLSFEVENTDYIVEPSWYEVSKKEIEKTGEKVYPSVIEPAFGLERVMYAVLTHSFDIDKIENEDRNVFRMPSEIAPYDALITPSVSIEELKDICTNLRDSLRENGLTVGYEHTGGIGRRYRRHDEIGTPYAITVDHQTLNDDTVTIRERDSTDQVRISLNNLESVLRELLESGTSQRFK